MTKKKEKKEADVFEFTNEDPDLMFVTPKGAYVFEQVAEYKKDYDEACEEFDRLYNEDGTPKLNLVSN